MTSDRSSMTASALSAVVAVLSVCSFLPQANGQYYYGHGSYDLYGGYGSYGGYSYGGPKIESTCFTALSACDAAGPFFSRACKQCVLDGPEGSCNHDCLRCVQGPAAGFPLSKTTPVVEASIRHECLRCVQNTKSGSDCFNHCALHSTSVDYFGACRGCLLSSDPKDAHGCGRCIAPDFHGKQLPLGPAVEACRSCVASGFGATGCNRCARLPANISTPAGEAAFEDCVSCIASGRPSLDCAAPRPLDGIQEWAREECAALTADFRIPAVNDMCLSCVENSTTPWLCHTCIASNLTDIPTPTPVISGCLDCVADSRDMNKTWMCPSMCATIASTSAEIESCSQCAFAPTVRGSESSWGCGDCLSSFPDDSTFTSKAQQDSCLRCTAAGVSSWKCQLCSGLDGAGARASCHACLLAGNDAWTCTQQPPRTLTAMLAYKLTLSLPDPIVPPNSAPPAPAPAPAYEGYGDYGYGGYGSYYLGHAPTYTPTYTPEPTYGGYAYGGHGLYHHSAPVRRRLLQTAFQESLSDYLRNITAEICRVPYAQVAPFGLLVANGEDYDASITVAFYPVDSTSASISEAVSDARRCAFKIFMDTSAITAGVTARLNSYFALQMLEGAFISQFPRIYLDWETVASPPVVSPSPSTSPNPPPSTSPVVKAKSDGGLSKAATIGLATGLAVAGAVALVAGAAVLVARRRNSAAWQGRFDNVAAN